ncbi:DnaD domain protein [Anaerosphaera multitolerans]|uniref:DnaD domain protein n=1 Tax=Anaerosphaera multitolerans TaxID=2487351 RepID=A0A437S9D2_9FIRM|nr:DnaD domain protein [Anaerosphaera multitolerans]RVU55723.1 DnaD domain protein [Anaerosphaera multitolerans]
MYFKLKKLSMDLGDTPIENIFINDYMPGADGNFVKVYLMGYKLARESGGLRKFDNNLIADLLGLIESDVLRAWDYWEKAGIVTKEYDGEDEDDFNIIFLNLKELYIQNIYSAPKIEERVDQNSILDDPKIADLLSKAEYYLRGQISVAKKQEIASWRDFYNMPVELIEEAFWYATEVKKIYKLPYIEGVIRNWSENNIRTMEDIQNSYLEYDEKYYRFLKVKERIGISNKAYNARDFELVNSWFDEHNMDYDLVMAASDKCINTNNPNLGYVNRILMNWKEKGITTVDDIEVLDKRKQKVVKTKFHNFKQLSDEYPEGYLEELAKKKREALFEDLKNDDV